MPRGPHGRRVVTCRRGRPLESTVRAGAARAGSGLGKVGAPRRDSEAFAGALFAIGTSPWGACERYGILEEGRRVGASDDEYPLAGRYPRGGRLAEGADRRGVSRC